MRFQALQKEFRPYLDEWGLIVENPWEGGDSACETFACLILLKWLGYNRWFDGRPLNQAYEDIASKLIHPTGLWRRHCAVETPNGWTDYWASEWDKGTRDNGTTALIATIVFNDPKRTEAMLALCRRRWWISPAVAPRNIWDREEDHIKYSPSYKKYDPTPRFGSPLLMWKSFFNRSIRKNSLTLWFWDILSSLGPVISVRMAQRSGNYDGNSLNCFIRVCFCYRYNPTLVSRLGYKLCPDLQLEKEFPPGGKNPPVTLLTNMLKFA